ncbi:hypothetical protein MMC19_005991 [Ptychographa xylographoides]|nr:hypothetical protein [Ptychographa xylographoides]
MALSLSSSNTSFDPHPEVQSGNDAQLILKLRSHNVITLAVEFALHIEWIPLSSEQSHPKWYTLNKLIHLVNMEVALTHHDFWANDGQLIDYATSLDSFFFDGNLIQWLLVELVHEPLPTGRSGSTSVMVERVMIKVYSFPGLTSRGARRRRILEGLLTEMIHALFILYICREDCCLDYLNFLDQSSVCDQSTYSSVIEEAIENVIEANMVMHEVFRCELL